MGKLGEILRELKEKEGSYSPLPPKKGFSLKRLFLFSGFVLIFISSFIAGFYLLQIVDKLKRTKTKEERISQINRPSPPRPLSQNESSSQIQKNLPQLKKKGTMPIPKQEEMKKKNLKTLTLKEKKQEGRTQPKRERMQKASSPKEALLTPLSTLSREGPPPLKKKELLENLLFNAEEERKRGNYPEAIKFYQEYLKHREDPDVLNNLGGIYLLLGDGEKARGYFERALKLRYDPYYELNLIMVLLKTGEKERACEKLKDKQFPATLEEKIKEIQKFCK